MYSSLKENSLFSAEQSDVQIQKQVLKLWLGKKMLNIVFGAF